MKSSTIHFFLADIRYVLRDKQEIRRWLNQVARVQGYKIEELNYVFCSDAYLLGLNKEYLNHSTLTDIITFDNGDQKGIIRGEIYISIDRIRENAAELAVFMRDELHRVMAHGLLHLCGYKDKQAGDKKKMTQAEDFSLSLRKFI